MAFKLYTIPNCSYCVKLIDFCNENKIQYTLLELTRTEYLESINRICKSSKKITKAPIVCDLENNVIGGYIAFRNWYEREERGLN